jgi:hypothetical protein
MNGKYEVKGVKAFRGMDTLGYNATLYRDGTKVALLVNDGSGGELQISWFDVMKPRVAISAEGYKGEQYAWNGTAEESALYGFVKSLNLGHGTDRWNVEAFLASLVDDFENIKRFKRICKSNTLYRLVGDPEGEWRKLRHPYDEAVKSHLVGKYGKMLADVMNTKEGFS